MPLVQVPEPDSLKVAPTGQAGSRDFPVETATDAAHTDGQKNASGDAPREDQERLSQNPDPAETPGSNDHGPKADDSATKELAAHSAASTSNGMNQVANDPATALLTIPRWLVFAQGGLLLTVALTFFLFGFISGRIGGSVTPVAASPALVELTGTVFYETNAGRVADTGSVVFVLPRDATVQQRLLTRELRPDSFQPFDNPAIMAIQEIGGHVVRVNVDGEYSVLVPPGKDYQILVISRNRTASESDEITKLMRAELGSFFFCR